MKSFPFFSLATAAWLCACGESGSHGHASGGAGGNEGGVTDGASPSEAGAAGFASGGVGASSSGAAAGSGGNGGTGNTGNPGGAGGSAGSPLDAATGGLWILAPDDPLVNPTECPPEDPAEGSPCAPFGLVCRYGDDVACRSRWGCSWQGTWSLNFARRDCPGDCPTPAPAEGTACPREAVLCSYGASPECRTVMQCWRGTWSTAAPAGNCEPAYCPVSDTSVNGVACDATHEGAYCVYNNSIYCECSCVTIASPEQYGGQYTWSCPIPIPRQPWSACPETLPADGTSCSVEAECYYFASAECTPQARQTVTTATCSSGTWSVTP